MARLTTSLAVLLCLSVIGGRAAQQAPQRPRRDAAIPAPPVGSASVTGTVVHDLTGQPVRRATVTVRATDGGIAYLIVYQLFDKTATLNISNYNSYLTTTGPLTAVALVE